MLVVTKNIKKNIKTPNILFDYKLDKREILLLKSILNQTFEGNNVESKEFNFYFPRLNVNDFKDLQKLIANQKSYFIKTNQIIKKIKFKQEKDNK